jgi:hypothetical protein
VRSLVVAVLVGALAAPARSGSPYAADARVAYLREALDAVRGLGPDGRRALEDGLYTGARTRCRAALGPPTTACLLDLARSTCAGDAGCERAADVVLVAILSENDLVDEATRIRLVGQSADYRAAMRAELHARRAALAAELVLAEPGGDDELPARIDRFCRTRERDPAWQRCAAALVWYIGSEGQP